MNNFYLDYCSGPSFVRFIEIQRVVRVVRLIQTQSIGFFFFLRTDLLFWVYISSGGTFFLVSFFALTEFILMLYTSCYIKFVSYVKFSCLV